MTRYWLDSKFLEYFIEQEIFKNNPKEIGEFSNAIDGARNWNLELILFNYLLSIHLLSYKKRCPLEDVKSIERTINESSDTMYLTVDNFEDHFITYLMSTSSNKDFELIEELIQLHEDYMNYNYEQTIHSRH